MTKASIIITTYKRTDILLSAVNSCLNQTYQNLEIVVVDDNGLGSPFQRDAENILHDLIIQEKIKYLPLEKNSGACFARNEGVRIATGDYVFFLDDDDEFLPQRVEKQVAFLDNNPEYDAHTVSFIKKKDGEELITSDGVPVIGDFVSFLKFGNFYTLMLAIRREAFLEVGGFRDIPRYQDMFFMYHLLAAHKEVAVSNEVLFVVHEDAGERISTKGIGATKRAVKALKDFTQPFEDGFSIEDRHLIEARRQFMLASTYYSSDYLSRLKSIPLWVKIYKLTNNKHYLVYLAKSLFPSAIIKFLERAKQS